MCCSNRNSGLCPLNQGHMTYDVNSHPHTRTRAHIHTHTHTHARTLFQAYDVYNVYNSLLIMSFKILLSISKNEESDMKALVVAVVSGISVSVVTAVAGELLLISAGFAISLADDLKFLFEGDATLYTRSFDNVSSLVLVYLVYRLPLNLDLVYNNVPPLFRLRETAISASYLHPYQFKYFFMSV